MPELAQLRILVLSVAAAVLAACAAGPDYARPELAMEGRFARDAGAGGVEATAVVATTPAPDAEFWTTFDDPTLTRLVGAALSANHDLRVALARYDAANALAREAGFDRFPTVTATAGASDGRSSADQLPGATRDERDAESYDAAIVASWELDLFGRVRRNVEAARADTRASALDLAALQVIIAGEVAESYVELRGLQERLRVARENAENQRETLRLVDVRLAAGRGTEFDTSRARAQLESTLARVPALEAAVAVTQHRLAVLTGNAPGALIAELDAAVPLPALPDRLDPATPGDLLRRRPDVAAAEARLHAATARIGVATADLFPRFTLAGLIGSQAVMQARSSSATARRGSWRSASTGRSSTWAGCARGSPPPMPAPPARWPVTNRPCCSPSRTPRTRSCSSRMPVSRTSISSAPPPTVRRPRSSRACGSTPAPRTCSTCWTPSAASSRHRTPSPTAGRVPRPRWSGSTARWPVAGRPECRNASK